MILTSHQTSVGSVLEFGSQLINEGIVVGKEERDIKDQMSLLSDKWENLRIAAMQRQSEYVSVVLCLENFSKLVSVFQEVDHRIRIVCSK